MKKCIFLLGCVLAIMSCSPPRALEYRTFHNLSVKSLGFDKSTISLDLEYYNSNNFGLQLKQTDLDVYVDGNLLGHSLTDTLVSIPRNSTFIIPVKFDVNMKNAFKNALSTLMGKEVLIRLSGKIKAGKGKVFMSIPVEYETKQTFSMF